MASILITGGAGFIGSNLAAALGKGHSVTVLDDFSTGKKENLRGLPRVKIIKGDICDRAKVRESLKGIDSVIHLAAIASVPRSIRNPAEANRVNAGGTVNLLFESCRAEVDRFIFASSSAVYGNAPGLPKTEDSDLAPISPYAATKLAGEKFCLFFERNFGISTVSFRYFNIYGPRQDPESEYAAVIPRFMELMGKGKRPVIFGDGEQTRDFTYIKDILSANELALGSKKGSGEVFNIATGKETSLNELVETLSKILKRKVEPVRKPSRPGDIMHSVADISKAKKTLGFKPKFTIVSGLEDMSSEG